MTIVISLIPFLFIIYYFYLVRKTKLLSIDLKSGQLCYSCKQELDVNKIEVLENLISSKEKYQLCKPCQRDEKLDGLINKNKLSRLHKLKLYLINGNFDKTIRYLLFSIVFLLMVDILLKTIFNIKWFSYVYNLIICLYWILMIYRHKLISIKKPSE